MVDDVCLAWERYLTVGGFPRAVADIAAGQIDVAAGTANGMWNILIGDVLRVGRMSERDINALLDRLVQGLCSPLSIANIAAELNIGARNTIADRIDRICASLYGWRASVTHDGVRRVPGGVDKLYFIDPLVARLPHLHDPRNPEPDVSHLAEQQLGNALLATIARDHIQDALDESTLLVRRNPDSGAEIDFVGDRLGVAIESKYVSDGWKQEGAAIAEHYGQGIVATRDVLDLDDPVWAAPAGLLAWMIDRD